MDWPEAAVLVGVLVAAAGGAFTVLHGRVERLDERMRRAEKDLAVLEPVLGLVSVEASQGLSGLARSRRR
ncbi:MAG: hypothetical protein QOD77_1509 [Thermoplasmata archaeon]|jgi:hypothetical protein|nr:hypothetical protein [Thermoplasmata archaeon]